MSSERVIALIDMDCFYVQCEQRLQPELWSHPCAVAQYNNWKGGGLIAVNYEARGYGVKRGMRGDEAKQLCPDLYIFSVPEVRGKAELSRYREGSAQVFSAIIEFVNQLNPNIIVEKASIDEAFIDLTNEIDNRVMDVPQLDRFLSDTKVEFNGNNDFDEWRKGLKNNEMDSRLNDIRLAIGAVIVKQIRDEILDKSQFKCSAGISHNKMLSKLCCAINKPNAQTILPKSGVDHLFKRIDINNVRGFGGKFGDQVKKHFAINYMFELKSVEMNELSKHFDRKTVKLLTDLVNGVDDEPVSNRQVSKSLGCGKNFPGKTALATLDDIKHWLKQLCEELVERMTGDKQVNKRAAKLLTVGFRTEEKAHNSKSLPLESHSDPNKLCDYIIKNVFSKKFDPLISLSISASKFVDDCDDPANNTSKLETYFSKIDKNHEIINDIDYENYDRHASKKVKPNKVINSLEKYLLITKTHNETDIETDDIQLNNLLESNYLSDESNVIEIEVIAEPLKKKGFFHRKMLEMEIDCNDSILID